MDAVKLFHKGWSMRKIARHMGFNVSTISRWVEKAPDDARRTIPTLSCRPHHHPHALPQATVDLICELRRLNMRLAQRVWLNA
jgi:transposase